MKFRFRFMIIQVMLVSTVTSGAVKYVGPNEYYTSIKWAYNESAEGDTIIVKNGTYTENILIDKSIVLISENLHGAVIGAGDGTKGYIRISEGSVLIDGFKFSPNNSSNGIVVGTMDPEMKALNCIIKNNQITGRNTGIIISPFAENTTLINNILSGSNQTGINMSGNGNSIFSGNHVLNSKDHGVFINETMEGSLLLLNDTIIESEGTGITIESDNVTLSGSLIKENGEDGVRTNSGRHNIFLSEGNTILSNQGNGIVVETGTSMVIENNEILDNFNHGIAIQDGGTASVSGNTIYGNQFNGIMCYGSVELYGNTLSGNMPNGIEVFGSAELENNTISENADLGIFIQPGSTEILIKGNLIQQNTGGGLLMAAGGQVIGNTFDGNRSGINVEASDAVVHITEGNKIINQVEHGILVSPVGQADINDNQISGNGTGVFDLEDFSGIFISGSATIRNNYINDNGASGILIGHDAGELIIRDNPEINGNREGILMYAPARMENNEIQDNINQGILIGEGADNSILKSNIISGNRTGIAIRENVSNVSVFSCNIISNERGVVSKGVSVFIRNNISNNTANGIRIAQSGIDLGQKDEEKGGYNLISDNTPWNIVNLTADTVFACYNFWGTADTISIDSTISDNEEDSLAGPVIFYPLTAEDPTGIETKKDHQIRTGGIIHADVYPNPFKDELFIEFVTESKAPVYLWIYSIDGQIIKNLSDGMEPTPGNHIIQWDGKSSNGKKMPDGFYIMELQIGRRRISRIVQVVR